MRCILYLVVVAIPTLPAVEPWSAPADAAALAKPFPTSPATIATGKGLYTQYCQICHGSSGKGDGDGAAALNPKPASLADTAVAGQSDGALFWKINTGRSFMPGWKPVLTDDAQRWALIDYVRTFAKPPTPK